MRVFKSALFATSAITAFTSIASTAWAQTTAAPPADQQRPQDCSSADQVNDPSGRCARTNAAQPGDAAAAAARTGSSDNGIASPANSAPATTSPDQTSSTGAEVSGSAPAADSTVVVTGSRLRNTEFTAASPVQVITGEESTLRGFANTSAIIQGATVAGNGTQINNNFSGYVVNGGPGVNTVSLRGLGADRTLVLLNGKRLGPAGAQGAVSSVDLNTIPATIIDRIEIGKDGSSSIYGSDAVAGIVNIITKQNVNGGDIHVYGNPTIAGGGGQGDIAGDYGRTWSRGYVNASFDIYRQEALHNGDRDYFACIHDNVHGLDGGTLDLTDPGTGQRKCENSLAGVTINAANSRYYLNTPGSAATLTSPADLTRVNCTIGLSGLCLTGTPSPSLIDVNATRLNRALVPESGYDEYFNATAVSPVRRYTTTISAGYDVLPKYMTVYGDFLYNKRQSSQDGYQQAFPILDPANPSNPLRFLGAAARSGSLEDGTAGSLAEPVVLNYSDSRQDVDYYRGVAGVRGALPEVAFFKSWRYDISAQFSRSDASYSQDYMRLDRLNATTGPSACDVNYVNPYLGGDSLAMHEPGAACQPIDWTRAVQSGVFSADERAFLFGESVGHTTYEQAYVEGDFNGDLFQLPAGAVSADVGFHVRRDRIKDVPSDETLNGNTYNFSTSGVTRGAQNVQEGFGEIGIPILRDLPFVKRLTLDVSGRYSHYDTAGDAKTYKAALNWQITSWLGIKYDQGTSFRAPALYELYLADQSGFVSQVSIDPCVNYETKATVIQQRCAAQGIPTGYTGGGSSAEVTSGGNSQTLTPETSFAKTVGVVFQPRWFGLDLNAEVDYYENKIHSTITQFGANNILNQCYSNPTYPNGYCNLFTRDPTTFQILNVTNNYLNVGSVIDRGIDLTIRSSFKLPAGFKLRFDSQNSWTIQETTELLPGTVTDYNGTSGTPRYVGNLNFRVDKGPWTFNWFVSLVGPTSDADLISNLLPSYRGTGVEGVFLDRASFYSISNISLRRSFGGDLTIEGGLLNAFDRTPPGQSLYDSQSSQSGNAVLASQYDYIGRSIFIQLDKKF